MVLLMGRECRLGYGIDVKINYIVPFTCVPSSVQNKKFIEKSLSVKSMPDQRLLIWDNLGPLLADSYLRYLDHQIVFDDKKYYLVDITVATRIEECAGSRERPPNMAGYVYKIGYGIEMYVIMEAEELPANEIGTWEAEHFLRSVLTKKASLSESQNQLKCRVLTNCAETRQMTLGQVFDFIDQFEAGKHEEYSRPVMAWSQEIKELRYIGNTSQFGQFLIDLYSCFRRIEIVLEKFNFPAETPSETEKIDMPFPEICRNLEETRQKYRNIEGFTDKSFEEQNDVIVQKLYPVLKKLFFMYQTYSKCVINERIEIQKEYYYWDVYEFKQLLKKLNVWNPVGCLSIFGDDPTHNKIRQKLQKNKNWKHILILQKSSLNEPLLSISRRHLESLLIPRQQEQINDNLIGFINMQGASSDAPSDVNNVFLFTHPCPRKCTADVRLWICSNCCQLVKLTPVYGLVLSCDCGSKLYADDILTCVNPQHEETLKIDLLPGNLKNIVNQLKKHQNRYDSESDNVIKSAIKTVINNHKMVQKTRDILEKINNLTVTRTVEGVDISEKLDGDTLNLINGYLATSDNRCSNELRLRP